MAVYRTAQGKLVDMTALAAKNEKTRAVGNMPVNARGDTIDSQGRVILPVTKKVSDKYQRAVASRAEHLTQSKQASSEEEVLKPNLKLEITEEDELLAQELAEFEIDKEDQKEE